MNWSELEDIIIDSRKRLGSIYIMFGWNKEKGFANKIKHNEALGENGAVKDVAKVWENVTTLCNYMFADGTIDVTNDLLEIRQMADELSHEAMKHESCKQLVIPCHKVVQNIDMYFTRRDNRQERELKDLLPNNLKGDEAVNIFQRAIDAGMIEQTATGLKWNGTKATLAYFMGHFLVCGAFPDKEYSRLFEESRLGQALYRLCYNKNGGGKPRGYEKIDLLFG